MEEHPKKILHRFVDRAENPIGWMFWCPGCEGPHAVCVEQPNDITGAKWTFDGNEEKPTFAPSVLCFTTYDAEQKPLPAGERRTLCHCIITAGMIHFCGDSPHALAGQTVPLPLH